MRAMRALVLFSMMAGVAVSTAACGGDDGGTTVTPPPPSPANRAPVAVGSLRTLTIQVGTEDTVNVASNFSDPDGDALNYAASTSDAVVATATVSGRAVSVTGVGAGTATGHSPRPRRPERHADGGGGEPPADGGRGTRQPDRLGGRHHREGCGRVLRGPRGRLAYTQHEQRRHGCGTASVDGSALTVVALAEGSSTVTVTATDTADNSNAFEFTVTVEALKRAPEVTDTIPPQMLTVGDTVRLDPSDYFSDPADQRNSHLDG